MPNPWGWSRAIPGPFWEVYTLGVVESYFQQLFSFFRAKLGGGTVVWFYAVQEQRRGKNHGRPGDLRVLRAARRWVRHDDLPLLGDGLRFLLVIVQSSKSKR